VIASDPTFAPASVPLPDATVTLSLPTLFATDKIPAATVVVPS